MGVGSSRGKTVLTSLAGRGGCLAKGKKKRGEKVSGTGYYSLGYMTTLKESVIKKTAFNKEHRDKVILGIFEV